uniref:Calcineurin-like phosphoesterase domain-containing protein n=1 Tax=Parascaris univalens TaxID=6257 RepID=A0A915C7X5_PARUN
KNSLSTSREVRQARNDMRGRAAISWRRVSTFNKRPLILLLSLQLITLIWNEWLAWEWCERFWDIRYADHDQGVHFLIVADPQLIGYQEERLPFPTIIRWDADRYLRIGFERALRASKANVVVFLGDLMNEGIQMSKAEFNLSLSRFESTFQIPASIQKIYVCGDNDVGGEQERVIPYLVGRFSRHFLGTFDAATLGLQAFNFVHVNAFNGAIEVLWNSSSSLTVVFSHLPIVKFRSLVQQVRQKLNPILILSAHEHVASFYEEDRHESEGYKSISLLESGSIVRTVGDDFKLVEFQTATCSYRMGVPNMAYGMLSFFNSSSTIQRSFEVRYTSLWLPRRFPQLEAYFVIVIVSLLVLLKISPLGHRLLCCNSFFKHNHVFPS